MRLLLLSLLLLFSSICHTQLSISKKPTLSTKKITGWDSIRLNRSEFKLDLGRFPNSAYLQPGGLKIINQGRRLFLLENGTGRIFETGIELDSLSRVDKTQFGGYCYGASFFMFRDTLYSVGGYGFWQLNGIVRYFDNTTKEWAVKPTNIEIPFADGVNSVSYFDQEKGILYLLYENASKETITNKNSETAVYLAELDLGTANWVATGLKVDKKWADRLSDFGEITTGPRGLILDSKKNPFSLCVEFDKKVVTEIQGEFIVKKKQLFSSLSNYITYWKDDTLLLYNYDADSILSMPLIKKKGQQRLLALQSAGSMFTIDHKYIDQALILCLALSIGIIVVQLKKKKNRSANPLFTEDQFDAPSYKTKGFFLLLDQIEKDTLQLLVKNSLKTQRTSIDEINKALQITNRPYKIQNNIRAEVIAQINKKYSAFNEIKEELIIRKRAAFDKRYLEYQINERLLKKISDINSHDVL